MRCTNVSGNSDGRSGSKRSHLDSNKTALKEALLAFNVDIFFPPFFVCLDEDYREITCPIVFRGSANRMIAGGRGGAVGNEQPLPLPLLSIKRKQGKRGLKMHRDGFCGTNWQSGKNKR